MASEIDSSTSKVLNSRVPYMAHEQGPQNERALALESEVNNLVMETIMTIEVTQPTMLKIPHPLI